MIVEFSYCNFSFVDNIGWNAKTELKKLDVSTYLNKM